MNSFSKCTPSSKICDSYRRAAGATISVVVFLSVWLESTHANGAPAKNLAGLYLLERGSKAGRPVRFLLVLPYDISGSDKWELYTGDTSRPLVSGDVVNTPGHQFIEYTYARPGNYSPSLTISSNQKITAVWQCKADVRPSALIQRLDNLLTYLLGILTGIGLFLLQQCVEVIKTARAQKSTARWQLHKLARDMLHHLKQTPDEPFQSLPDWVSGGGGETYSHLFAASGAFTMIAGKLRDIHARKQANPNREGNHVLAKELQDILTHI